MLLARLFDCDDAVTADRLLVSAAEMLKYRVNAVAAITWSFVACTAVLSLEQFVLGACVVLPAACFAAAAKESFAELKGLHQYIYILSLCVSSSALHLMFRHCLCLRQHCHSKRLTQPT